MHQRRIPEWLRHRPAPSIRGFSTLAAIEAVIRGILISVYPLAMYQALQDAKAVSEIYFFVSWLNDDPVGHALVRWLGPREETVRRNYPDCPEIYRLKVLKEFRDHEIATAIIKKCENEAIKRHCLLIGLGINPNISSKDNLYKQSDYEPSTVSSYIDTYKTRLEDGTIVTIRKDAQFLIKKLRD